MTTPVAREDWFTAVAFLAFSQISQAAAVGAFCGAVCMVAFALKEKKR